MCFLFIENVTVQSTRVVVHDECFVFVTIFDTLYVSFSFSSQLLSVQFCSFCLYTHRTISKKFDYRDFNRG